MIKNYSDTVRTNFTDLDPTTNQYDVLVERLIDDKWEVVVGYNSMSNDYAYTNAKEHARMLAIKFK